MSGPGSWLVALASLASLGCSAQCLRNSDCSQGSSCVLARCTMPASDAGQDGGGVTSAVSTTDEAAAGEDPPRAGSQPTATLDAGSSPAPAASATPPLADAGRGIIDGAADAPPPLDVP